MTMPLLDIKNLHIDIPTNQTLLRPVRGISLQVWPGETLAIVGESGCGKSLSSLAIMGLLPRSAVLRADHMRMSGETLINLSHKEWSTIRGNRIAMIFQDPMTALDPCYRIGDQMIEIYRHHRGGTVAQARARALELLESVGVPSAPHRLQQYPHQLSGGLRQRVMIAMALLCDPELLIADEPTTALDVTIQAQILQLLAHIQRKTGIGLILITHDLGVVAGIADRVAVMYGGEIVETGSCDDVLAHPQHPYTEGLIHSIPTPGKTPRGSMLGFIPGTVPLQTGGRHACGFIARCPYAQPACGQSAIALNDLSGNRSVRCLLPAQDHPRNEQAWLQLPSGTPA